MSTAIYENQGTKSVSFDFGHGLVECAPGDRVEGPEGYANAYKRNGLTLVGAQGEGPKETAPEVAPKEDKPKRRSRKKAGE